MRKKSLAKEGSFELAFYTYSAGQAGLCPTEEVVREGGVF